MLKRYPHIGKLNFVAETDNGTSTPVISKTEREIKGRYEPNSQKKSLDYSAKWYCSLSEVAGIENFQVDGQPFYFKEKQFKVIQLFPYQTHCEIWLE